MDSFPIRRGRCFVGPDNLVLDIRPAVFPRRLLDSRGITLLRAITASMVIFVAFGAIVFFPNIPSLEVLIPFILNLIDAVVTYVVYFGAILLGLYLFRYRELPRRRRITIDKSSIERIHAHVLMNDELSAIGTFNSGWWLATGLDVIQVTSEGRKKRHSMILHGDSEDLAQDLLEKHGYPLVVGGR